MNKYNQSVFWNQRTYGSAIMINKFQIKAAIVALGFIIPIVFPVPLALWLTKFVKTGIIWRY